MANIGHFDVVARLEAWTDHQDMKALPWSATLVKDLEDAIAEIYRLRHDFAAATSTTAAPDFAVIRQKLKTR